MKKMYIMITILLVIIAGAWYIQRKYQKQESSKNMMSSPENLGYSKLTDLSKYQGKQLEAASAIIFELQNKKEYPDDFYIKPSAFREGSKIAFELVHKDSFKLENVKPGNQSGKDRIAIYSLSDKQVTFLLSK